jgi:hypothetical protein
MAPVSCSLYFFANDGISPFIPLWIARAMCAPLIWSFRRLGHPRPHPRPDHGSEHSFEGKNFVLWRPSFQRRAACFQVPSPTIDLNLTKSAHRLDVIVMSGIVDEVLSANRIYRDNFGKATSKISRFEVEMIEG